MELNKLMALIQQTRADINGLYETSLLTDDKVLHKSRKLDELLNMYDKYANGIQER